MRDEASWLLVAIAALDEEATIEHLVGFAERDAAVVEAAVVALTDAGLAKGTSSLWLTPLGTKMLGATADSLLPARTRAAEVLHGAGAPAVAVAERLLRLPPVRRPWALDALRAAARQLGDGGDQPAAAAALQRAVEERPPSGVRIELLLELGLAQTSFDTEAAIKTYRTVLPLLEPARRTSARIRLARLLAAANRVDEALAEADVAIEEAATDTLRLRAELSYVTVARQSLDTRDLGRERLRRLAATVDPTFADQPSRNLLAELGYEQVLDGSSDHRAAIATLTAAFGGPTLEGVHGLLPAARYAGLLALSWCGELRLVDRAARLVIARTRRRGAGAGYDAIHQVVANVAFHRGELQQAIDRADVVLEASDVGVRTVLPGATGLKAAALATLGRFEEAVATLALPGGEEPWVTTPSFQGYLLWRSLVCLAAGDPEGALVAAQRCGTLAGVMGTMNPAVLPWRAVGSEAALALGETAVASSLAADSLGLSRRFGAPAPIAAALRLVARLAPDDDAVALLREGEALLSSTPYRIEKIRMALGLGRALARTGDFAGARASATRAVALATEIGSISLGAEATAMLDRLENRGSPRAPAAAARGRATLEIRALGQFAVVDAHGQDVTPTGVAGRAIRILVAAGGSLHVEQLADRLWDEPLAPPKARARLANVLARTRTSMGPVLVRSGQQVLIDADVELDVDRFEAAAKALAAASAAAHRDLSAMLHAAVAATLLYGGDLLPTDPYADWCAPRRDELRRRYLSAADQAAPLAAAVGLIDLAADVLEGAIRHDPHDIDRYERLASLLEVHGRPSAARTMRDRGERAERSLAP